ncbi:MAG: HAD-IIB family hydrolase, partial [Pseudomonadota bacterium]
ATLLPYSCSIIQKKMYFMNDTQIIIFSDMDGSLLDHDSYSHADADDLLKILNKLNIPVIPCTSKTFAEMEVIRAELENKHPFVIENGAAVYIPMAYFDAPPNDLDEVNGYYVKAFVKDRHHWQSILGKFDLHSNKAFLTFEQAGTTKIAEMTGLRLEQARLANERQYGEPLQWQGTESEYHTFKQYIDQQGGKLLKGGRFVHLSGECDKGKSLNWLMDLFKSHNPNQNLISIALGDSQNDVAMIEAADYGILIQSPVHHFPETRKMVYKTKATGSKGWVEGIMHVFNTLEFRLENKASL